MKWRAETIRRESVGIEPTSPLAKASAVLKTVRTTRSVLSHVPGKPHETRVPDEPDSGRESDFRHFANVLLTDSRRPLEAAGRPWQTPHGPSRRERGCMCRP